MNTPIISPWFFYVLSFADFLKGTLVFLTIALFIVDVVLSCEEGGDALTKKEKKKMWSFWVFIFLASVLFPSQRTLLTMKVTSLVTEQNLTTAYDMIITTVEKILTTI